MRTQQIILFILCIFLLGHKTLLSQNPTTMQVKNEAHDKAMLTELNAQFIKNYIAQDVKAHSELIHRDFVCIENNGNIIGREEYLKNWASDYQNSGVESFTCTDVVIRIFGDMALVRAKSVYTKRQKDKLLTGYSVYTDTYVKEQGRWWCVQAHMTPVQ